MRNKLLFLLSLGLFIRILLMPLTGHEDLRLINWASLNVFDKGIASIYDTEKSVYPPPIYLMFATWQKIISPVLGNDFKNWLTLPTVSNFESPLAFRYYFLLKLPYLFFDLGIAALLFTLAKFVGANHDSPEQPLKFVSLWLFSPIAIYVTSMFGQFDVIPTFFVILSLFLLYKKHYFSSVFVLGISSIFKLFPLYFLPFLLFALPISNIKKIIYGFLGLLPLAVSTIPFINLPAFQKNVLFGAHTANIGHASLYIGGDQTISVFLIIYTALLLLFYFSKTSINNLWKYFLVVLLVFYSLSDFHPQWFLWITPFLIYWWMKDRSSHPLQLILYFLYLVIVFLFEPSVHIGLFGPLSTFFVQIPSFGDLSGKFIDPNIIRGYVHSLFAGISFFAGFHILRGSKQQVE